MSDVYRHFSWTMLTLAHDGYADFSVYDKKSGKILERIYAKDHVLLYQYQKLLNVSPSAQTQYAHYLYNNLKIDRKDVGISCYCEVNFNARGWERIMNDDVDLAREKIHVLFPYSWY